MTIIDLVRLGLAVTYFAGFYAFLIVQAIAEKREKSG